MKKWAGVISVFLLLGLFYPPRALEQTTAYDPTVLNGLSWGKMGLLEHVFFMAGYQSGVRFGSRQTAGDEPKHLIYDRFNARARVPTGTNEGVLQQVDTFYKDPRNAQVCWADALEISTLTLNGAVFTEDELNVVRSADANDRCLGQSPGTPQAGALIPSPKNTTYPDSSDGLQHYLQDLRSEFQKEAVPNEDSQGGFVVLPSTLEALQKRVLLPNHTDWFNHVFGVAEGPNLAIKYSSLKPDDMLPLFLALHGEGDTFHILRLEDVVGNGSAPFAMPILEAMKSKSSSYIVHYELTNPTAERDIQVPYYFFYVDGEFRPILTRVFSALSSATAPGVGPPLPMKPISEVQPVYPQLARQGRIQGNVVFHAIIAKDGTVQSLDLISGHPMLVQAAMDAARQRRYRPSLFKGRPIQAATTITIRFILTAP